jgi:hypothetical protein
MAAIRLKAEEDSAYLWIKVGSEQARFIRKETHKLPLLDSLIKLYKKADKKDKIVQMQKRKQEHLTNIRNALSSYTDSIRQINTLSQSAVQKGFKRYLEFLMSRKDTEQVQVLNRVQKHFKAYQKNKRVNLKRWKEDVLF